MTKLQGYLRFLVQSPKQGLETFSRGQGQGRGLGIRDKGQGQGLNSRGQGHVLEDNSGLTSPVHNETSLVSISPHSTACVVCNVQLSEVIIVFLSNKCVSLTRSG